MRGASGRLHHMGSFGKAIPQLFPLQYRFGNTGNVLSTRYLSPQTGIEVGKVVELPCQMTPYGADARRHHTFEFNFQTSAKQQRMRDPVDLTSLPKKT